MVTNPTTTKATERRNNAPCPIDPDLRMVSLRPYTKSYFRTVGEARVSRAESDERR
jgi:hypothetical protein